MRKLLNLASAHPWPVLLAILLVSVGAASQLHRLQIHVSSQGLAMENDPAKVFHESVVATFGADNITQIFISDHRLFNDDKLEALRTAVANLESLPFVERTDSLFSLPNIRVIDDSVYTDPYLKENPKTPEQAERIRQQALKNPFVRHNLLSEDGTAMAINVHINPAYKDPEFDAEVAASIRKTITPLETQFNEVFQVGQPYIRTLVSELIQKDQKTLLPLAVIVLLLTLAITLRRANAAIIPLLTAGLSILWTLGGMAALGIPVNVMTAIVPVMLIIIGSTEDIHLISEYQKGVIAGHGRHLSIQYMARRMGLAVLLTFFTSYLGFLSIIVNPIQLLYEFGLVASTGLAFNFLITAALIPVYLRFFGDRHPTVRNKKRNLTHRAIGNVCHLVQHRKSRILLFTLSLLAIAAYGSLSIQVNNNILDYFNESSPVKYRAMTLHDQLSGMESFSIILDGDIEDTFLRSRYLEEVVKIQDYLDSSPSFDSNISITDYLALLNSAMNDSGMLELPDDDEVLSELNNFINHKNIKGYVSPDFSQARIVVRHNLYASYDLNMALAELQSFIDNNIDHGLHVDITGESILTSQTADKMAEGQAKSLGLMLLVIFTVISLLFVNVKAGLLATLPNLFPIIMLFGVMGFTGIPLDSATSMIAAIALGICVDNTMHFMVRYNRALTQHKSEARAIQMTMQEEATPITAATIALFLGLGVMVFSSFTPIAYFGVLSGMVILLAYYANFFITPLLLSSTRLITLWDLLSLELRRGLIHDCPLFKGMLPRQIKRVILMSQVRDYKAGEAIMYKGEEGKEMFILLEGRGEVSTVRQDTTVESTLPIEAGHVFGLTALLCESARNSTAIALEDSKVLVLTWDSIQRGARFYPHIIYQLFRNLSAILANRFAENESTHTPITTTMFQLENFPLQTSKRVSTLDTYTNPAAIHLGNRSNPARLALSSNY
ncbi:MAG: MMPL family transporter [Candidatus Thiodiazotropha sp. (ex Monitilora ramsayi)]|nr:MMPL family transporter [Candidatus Thiodiazotropha sp. (ex Monitilora ramsayi)]